MSKSYQNIKITQLPKRLVEIVGEIGKEEMTKAHGEALAKIKETFTADGFRAGNVPENIIVQKVGEMAIMERAAETALNKAYPEILEAEKLDAIGKPDITITKIAPGNALEFKIKTALAPEIKLSNYKKIAEKFSGAPEEVVVTAKEIDDVILDVRKNVAHAKLHQHDTPENKEKRENHDHGEITEADLPPLDEQFLKDLGGFPSVEDLRAKIEENLKKEKEHKAKDKNRSEILEAIIKESEIEIPDIVIESELEKMLAQFKDDIARANVHYSEYLKHIQKTEDDLKREWRESAEKRAKAQITLSRIAREEKIEPAEVDIKKEMDHILSHQKDAPRFHVRMFVETMLQNELVFQFLESVS